jgi:hypothetical protein
MRLSEFIATATELVYRLATYANNHLIDDPALLALVFC